MDLNNVHDFGFIIHEGLQGRHVLFDNQMIRESFARDARRYKKAPKKAVRATQAALRILSELPTLAEKREFISSLPDEIRGLLIYFYFQFLDKFLQELRPTLH
jgi:uncharacterized protein (DUF2267 family)